MKPVKRVEFTITRAEVWPWIQTICGALWYGSYRVNLTLTGEQTFVVEALDKEQT